MQILSLQIPYPATSICDQLQGLFVSIVAPSPIPLEIRFEYMYIDYGLLFIDCISQVQESLFELFFSVSEVMKTSQISMKLFKFNVLRSFAFSTPISLISSLKAFSFLFKVNSYLLLSCQKFRPRIQKITSSFSFNTFSNLKFVETRLLIALSLILDAA
jgi:hypothetical protein